VSAILSELLDERLKCIEPLHSFMQSERDALEVCSICACCGMKRVTYAQVGDPVVTVFIKDGQILERIVEGPAYLGK